MKNPIESLQTLTGKVQMPQPVIGIDLATDF